MIWPHDVLRDRYESAHFDSTAYAKEGITQPWVQLLLYALVRSLGATHVLELGCFRGVTTAWLALAVEANGGGTVVALDREAVDVARGKTLLRDVADALPRTQVVWELGDTRAYLRTATLQPFTFVFLDDDKQAVAEKVELLRVGGCRALLACHDVDGHYEDPGLARVWKALGGLVVPATRIHPYGHLGLLQL